MIRIILIRPGTTDFDVQGRIQGTLDIPLSDGGTAEVRRLADELNDQKISVFYTSPCQAALETATALADSCRVRLKKMEQLQNVDHGLWQGMLIGDVKRKQPRVYRQWREQPDTVCPPEGEMVGDALERVQSALVKIFRKHAQGTIGLVVPEPLASLVRQYLTKCQLSEAWAGCGKCGSWEEFLVEPEALAANAT